MAKESGTDDQSLQVRSFIAFAVDKTRLRFVYVQFKPIGDK